MIDHTLIFSFNPGKHNFWPIYEVIKKYYPIGISKETSIYLNYPGIKALEDEVVKHIHDSDTYQTLWQNFEVSLQQKLGKEVVGTTYGQAPSFSAFLKLNSLVQEQVITQKQLHFAVSLLGPFYTIYGTDAARFIESDADAKQEHPSTYESIIALTVSPYQEYETVFVQLQHFIEEHFQGYKLIPFAVCGQYIEGLQVKYLDQKVNTVYNALFNHLLFDEYTCGMQLRGDKFYGYQAWEVDSPASDSSDKWIILPPLSWLMRDKYPDGSTD